jgi:hypothetical protein
MGFPQARAKVVECAAMPQSLVNASEAPGSGLRRSAKQPLDTRVDVYFSADVETDGPIPGPFSMLSLALVYAGRFDGVRFERPADYSTTFYRELRPISDDFQPEALKINGLDRAKLSREGSAPEVAMAEASEWVRDVAGGAEPVLVAYPLSFDWSWLYWYFMRFVPTGSPFNHSRAFDIKTAFAVKAGIPVSQAGRANLAPELRSHVAHTHNALDDARGQAEIFANLFEWRGTIDGTNRGTPR